MPSARQADEFDTIRARLREIQAQEQRCEHEFDPTTRLCLYCKISHVDLEKQLE